MKFIVDECTGPSVARWLRGRGDDVLSVFEEHRGITDVDVLSIAMAQHRVLVTNDKDFGEMVFRSGKAHAGVILLRLSNETSANKIKVLEQLLGKITRDLSGLFIVVTESTVRVIEFP